MLILGFIFFNGFIFTKFFISHNTRDKYYQYKCKHLIFLFALILPHKVAPFTKNLISSLFRIYLIKLILIYRY